MASLKSKLSFAGIMVSSGASTTSGKGIAGVVSAAGAITLAFVVLAFLAGLSDEAVAAALRFPLVFGSTEGSAGGAAREEERVVGMALSAGRSRSLSARTLNIQRR